MPPTQLAKMSFDEILDLTADVFSFYNNTSPKSTRVPTPVYTRTCNGYFVVWIVGMYQVYFTYYTFGFGGYFSSQRSTAFRFCSPPTGIFFRRSYKAGITRGRSIIRSLQIWVSTKSSISQLITFLTLHISSAQRRPHVVAWVTPEFWIVDNGLHVYAHLITLAPPSAPSLESLTYPNILYPSIIGFTKVV